MEGADIYQIAKNCRTSVEMIEKYYGRTCNQCHADQEKQERQEGHPEHSGFAPTSGAGNGCVDLKEGSDKSGKIGGNPHRSEGHLPIWLVQTADARRRAP